MDHRIVNAKYKGKADIALGWRQDEAVVPSLHEAAMFGPVRVGPEGVGEEFSKRKGAEDVALPLFMLLCAPFGAAAAAAAHDAGAVAVVRRVRRVEVPAGVGRLLPVRLSWSILRCWW